MEGRAARPFSRAAMPGPPHFSGTIFLRNDHWRSGASSAIIVNNSPASFFIQRERPSTRFGPREAERAAEHGLSTVSRAARREQDLELARKRQNQNGHALPTAPEGRAVPAGAFVCFARNAFGHDHFSRASATKCRALQIFCTGS